MKPWICVEGYVAEACVVPAVDEPDGQSDGEAEQEVAGGGVTAWGEELPAGNHRSNQRQGDTLRENRSRHIPDLGQCRL